MDRQALIDTFLLARGLGSERLAFRLEFFMMAALENDELVHEAPVIVGCKTPLRSRTQPANKLQGRQDDVASRGRFLINTVLDAGPITLLMFWNARRGDPSQDGHADGTARVLTRSSPKEVAGRRSSDLRLQDRVEREEVAEE